MKKPSALIVATMLACPAFAADQTREQKRLATCGQVFKEVMDIPRWDSQGSAQQGGMRDCDSISPEVSLRSGR